MPESKLTDCTNALLKAIASGRVQKSIARTYYFAMHSSEPTDWPKVNQAIVKRWSRAGLIRIKKLAWSGKCFEAK